MGREAEVRELKERLGYESRDRRDPEFLRRVESSLESLRAYSKSSKDGSKEKFI